MASGSNPPNSLPSGYIHGLVNDLFQLEDGNYKVPAGTEFDITDKQISIYHMIVHMCCHFPRDENDLKQLERSSIIPVLEKALSDKGVVNVKVHVKITEKVLTNTTQSKDVKVKLHLHSSITKLTTDDELIAILNDHLSPFNYNIEKTTSGFLVSVDKITLKVGNKIPKGTHFYYFPELTNTHQSFKTTESDYELLYHQNDNDEHFWSNTVPITLQSIKDDTKLRVLTVIVTYYFEVHPPALHSSPLSAESITKYLSLVLQTYDFNVISVLVLPPVSNATSYAVKLTQSSLEPQHIELPEALIGISVATENTTIIPNVQSELQNHFNVSSDYEIVGYRVLPQVPPPS